MNLNDVLIWSNQVIWFCTYNDFKRYLETKWKFPLSEKYYYSGVRYAIFTKETLVVLWKIIRFYLISEYVSKIYLD